MRILFLCGSLVLALWLQDAVAGEMRDIELNDGSTITGEVLSLNSGIYTVRSDSLGTIRIEETKIRAIRARAASKNTGTAGEITTLQNKMMSDQEILGLIQSLQNDPEFQKILEDPELLKAVTAGDVPALMANPRFMKLLNNSTVQEIQKKVK
jgi:hypothetical protein